MCICCVRGGNSRSPYGKKKLRPIAETIEAQLLTSGTRSVPVIPAKEEPPSFYGRSEREHPELYCTAALAGKVGKLQIQRFVAQMGESSHFRAQQLTSRYAGLPYSATIIVPLS